MARIRTMKPELPQSRSMGRVSRDARLFFILTWTLMDDEGRARGESRMLASLLYPHDTDVSDALIDLWVAELEAQASLIRYEDDEGHVFIASLNWNVHQKIDRPTKSKLPAPPVERVRELRANVRERSRAISEPSRGLVVGPGPGPGPGPEDLDQVSVPYGTASLSEAPVSNVNEKRDAPPHTPNGGIQSSEEIAQLPLDDRTWLFRNGLQAVAKAQGRSEKAMRSTIGMWLKDCGDDAGLLRSVISDGIQIAPADPVAWITKAVQSRTGRVQHPAGGNGSVSFAMERENEHRARMGAYTRTGIWMENQWGPKPGDPGCHIPPRIIAEYDLKTTPQKTGAEP